MEASGVTSTTVEYEAPAVIRHFIDGEMCDSAGAETMDVVNPATGARYAQLSCAQPADIERAVGAARLAFPAWADLAARDRARSMHALADGIEDRAEEFARAESFDNGKPITFSRTVDIKRAIANLRFFAGAIEYGTGDSYMMGGTRTPDAINYVLRRPRGVAGCISPWNLPLYLFTWKIAPALATGNTVVGKPSEVTPLTASLLGEVARDVGFPRGVLNIVHGRGAEAGTALVGHPDVAAVSFTGGTATGEAIANVVAPDFRKLSLELGGKNPTVIFADANLGHAVPTAVRAAFANQGQICLCGSRILVERSIVDDVTRQIVEHAGAMRCGDPMDESTRQGALVSREHHAKVMQAIATACEEGGTVVCGGAPPDAETLPASCRGGFFLEPTVITGLSANCRTNQEEIFGPVATIIPFDDEADAIAIANGTKYGLAANIWTRDVNRAHRVSAKLDFGIVWVNCWLMRDLRTPFGGTKASGVGREGGEEAMNFFTEPTNVCVRVDTADTR